jgi:hypothetical protein
VSISRLRPNPRMQLTEVAPEKWTRDLSPANDVLRPRARRVSGRLRAIPRSWPTSLTFPPATSATASFLNWGVNVRRIRRAFLARRHLLESTY